MFKVLGLGFKGCGVLEGGGASALSAFGRPLFRIFGSFGIWDLGFWESEVWGFQGF